MSVNYANLRFEYERAPDHDPRWDRNRVAIVERKRLPAGVPIMLYYQRHRYATITFKGMRWHLARTQSQPRC